MAAQPDRRGSAPPMKTTGPDMSDNGEQRILGSTLVALQFGLIVLLAWLGLPSFLLVKAPVGAWVTAVAGAFVGIWAVSTNRPDNFNIRPVPRDVARLVQQGHYRWIRHPMYTAVMACGFAAAWANKTWLVWLALGVLVAVLVSKAVQKEAHAGYAAYRRDTCWFLPWIAYPLGIVRLALARTQELADGVAREARAAGDLPDGQLRCSVKGSWFSDSTKEKDRAALRLSVFPS